MLQDKKIWTVENIILHCVALVNIIEQMDDKLYWILNYNHY